MATKTLKNTFDGHTNSRSVERREAFGLATRQDTTRDRSVVGGGSNATGVVAAAAAAAASGRAGGQASGRGGWLKARRRMPTGAESEAGGTTVGAVRAPRAASTTSNPA